MLRALIFDFDGTILDTETPEYLAWQEIYAQHEAELPVELWARAVGTHDGFDPHTYLEECTGRTHNHAALAALHPELTRARLSGLPPRAGIRELLMAARMEGIRLAVASSSHRAYLRDFLARLELAAHFDTICAADDVARVKPDPALFLLALERLGVAAGEAVVIEDSPNGVLAAQAAGIPCLVVPNDLTRVFSFPAYGIRRESLAGVDLAFCAELCGIIAEMSEDRQE
jgi:HAD superfamily hydrolase (TIGR01509 family)